MYTVMFLIVESIVFPRLIPIFRKEDNYQRSIIKFFFPIPQLQEIKCCLKILIFTLL